MNRFSVGDLRGFDARVVAQYKHTTTRQVGALTARAGAQPGALAGGTMTAPAPSAFASGWLDPLPLGPSALSRSRLSVLGPKRRCCRSGCSGCPYSERFRPSREPAEPIG